MKSETTKSEPGTIRKGSGAKKKPTIKLASPGTGNGKNEGAAKTTTKQSVEKQIQLAEKQVESSIKKQAKKEHRADPLKKGQAFGASLRELDEQTTEGIRYRITSLLEKMPQEQRLEYLQYIMEWYKVRRENEGLSHEQKLEFLGDAAKAKRLGEQQTSNQTAQPEPAESKKPTHDYLKRLLSDMSFEAAGAAYGLLRLAKISLERQDGFYDFVVKELYSDIADIIENQGSIGTYDFQCETYPVLKWQTFLAGYETGMHRVKTHPESAEFAKSCLPNNKDIQPQSTLTTKEPCLKAVVSWMQQRTTKEQLTALMLQNLIRCESAYEQDKRAGNNLYSQYREHLYSVAANKSTAGLISDDFCTLGFLLGVDPLEI